MSVFDTWMAVAVAMWSIVIAGVIAMAVTKWMRLRDRADYDRCVREALLLANPPCACGDYSDLRQWHSEFVCVDRI